MYCGLCSFLFARLKVWTLALCLMECVSLQAAAHPALTRLLALWRQLSAAALEQAARAWAALPEEHKARAEAALAVVDHWWSRHRAGIEHLRDEVRLQVDPPVMQ